MSSSRDSHNIKIEGRVYLTTIIILILLITAAGILVSYVPRGEFVSTGETPDQDREYRDLGKASIPVWKIVLSPLLSLTGSSGPRIIVLILFILIIGGSFSVMNKSGLLPAILDSLVTRFYRNKKILLFITVVFFSLIGSALGILEEVVPLILIFVPLAIKLGWDPFTGIAIPFLSAGIGFAAATFNPFTLGTAQRLAGIPLFSGLSLRFPLFIVTTLLVVIFLLRYTAKFDKTNSVTEPLVPDGGNSFRNLKKAVVFIIICFSGLALLVAAGNFYTPLSDYSFPIIALIFLIMGIGVGVISGGGGKTIASYFFSGTLSFAPAIILILLAAAVGYIIETGGILPTLLNYVSPRLASLGRGGGALLLYFVQMGINFFIPSGSGQAVLTIPILAPLGDLIGVSRQTVVLAFQFGDGFSNLLWPTNPMLLIALGLAGIGYKDWLKKVLPLQGILFLICCGVLLLAVSIGY